MEGRDNAARSEAQGDNKSEADLRVRLLGGFSVSVEGRTVEAGDWRLRKAAALVKLLALEKGRRMHRDRIMDLLWPRLDEKAAANNLHHALHVARRVLDPASTVISRHLRLRDEQLELSPEGSLWVDVETFEEAANIARRLREPEAYRTALDLYGGELLPADRYEPWTEERREEIRRTYLSLLVELAALYEKLGEMALAVEALEKAVAAEPAHEEACTGLMRLYALRRRSAEALRQYERLGEIVSRDYGMRPTPASRRLYEDIKGERFPPARSPNGPPLEGPRNVRRHNLPASQTSFVGREKEIEEVKRLLPTTRLLTLSGAGGCGKTRLALEASKDLAGVYPDGVWLVELAPLSEGDLVVREVAEVVKVREQPGRPLADTLVDALRGREMLLLLDNCEHLMNASARLVETLLDCCTGLRILVTSREVLGVAGEANLQVPSLSLPEPGRPPGVEEISEYESAQLFVQRALYRSSSFALTGQNVRVVVEICRKLDGIPLAIELAAARVGVLSVEQILERLEDALKLLTTGGRTVDTRHQTLRGTLDWGYELLAETEKRLFFRLSVFAGGWTLEATEAVGAGNSIEKEDVLDLLGRLVDKSLVVMEAGEGGAPRYKMLEPVRQYAWERLRESGEADIVRSRHATFFLALAEEADKESDGPDHTGWLRRLDTEHDNMRAALGWSLDGGETELGLGLAGALWLFWYSRGHLSEGRGWLETALSRSVSGVSHARAKALKAAGWLALFQDEHEAAGMLLEESLALARELEDKEGIASSLIYLGFVAVLGQLDDVPVRAILEEVVGMRPELKDRRTVGNLLVFEGLVAASQGDIERSVMLHEEGLALFREIRDIQGMIYCLGNLGLLALVLADYERASSLLREDLRLGWETDHKMAIQYSFIGLAGVATSREQPARAARLWGAAEGIREAYGMHLTPLARSRTDYEGYLAAARSRLDETEFREAWAEGKAMTPEEAIEYAFLDEASSSTAPTPASPERTAKYNLPVPKSSFVGRERELVEVKERLAEARLLTLTGAGGLGKTRLAQRVAEELVEAYRDGVWFVELAPLSEEELLPQVVADALKVREQQERPMVETLIQALHEKEILLVLDNCEHLVDAVARLTDTMLGTCPGLKILATSREALGVEGEVNLRVSSLRLPDPAHSLAAEELKGYEAVRLFTERATHGSSALALTDGNTRAVAEICRRLDGIPLAIELAAARVGVLSVEQISERLEDSLELLTTGNRTATPRHRTLRGALDWSYDLLTEMEKDLFARLSVFAGGWALEAAEAVGADDDIGEGDILDLLAKLVDKSLVVAETSGDGGVRYRMLEPIRQYAREKLEESTEADQTKRRHAGWYLALVKEVDRESAGPGYVRWLQQLEIEHDNLRAALRWSLDEGDAEVGLRLAGSLWLFWFTRGHSTEGRRWLEESISLGGPKAARAKALNGTGWIALFQGDLERAKTLLEESLALYRELKDEEGIASSLNYLGYVALLGGRQDIPVAALLEEALALKPRLKNRHTIANTLVFAALDALLLRGDWDETVALHEEALALFREVEDKWGIAICLTNLGLIVAAMGRHDRARALLRELMRLSREVDDRFTNQYSFFGLACVADSEGHTMRAARLWGVSEAIREAVGLQLPSSTLSVMRYESRLGRARAALGEAAFEAAWAEGKAMPREVAVEYALSEGKTAPPATLAPEALLAEKPPDKLTRREEEVAALVARGLTNRRIAEELTLSRRTVDNHVRNILKKLRLNSRFQVATWVEERRLRGTYLD